MKEKKRKTRYKVGTIGESGRYERIMGSVQIFE
jgi:hypothetical protein